MYTPETYAAALVLMLASMVCWGSWPNFLKGLPGWRLEYFYFDYTLGFLLAVFFYGATMGSMGGGETPGFFARMASAGHYEVLMAVVGGFIWNVGNILLLTSIMIAGLAVAFPIAAIPAIIIGIGSAYFLQPIGNPLALGASVVLLLIAAQATAAAYRNLGQVSTSGRKKGIATALISGFLIGFFPPFVTAALTGERGLDSYVVSAYFMLGAFVATLIVLPLLLKKPLIGEASTIGGYWKGKSIWRVFGVLAGVVWCSGTVANFISAGMVGVAISVGIGSGAPMVGALWGILVWGEFAGAPRNAKAYIGLALALYVTGISSMAIAYTL